MLTSSNFTCKCELGGKLSGATPSKISSPWMLISSSPRTTSSLRGSSSDGEMTLSIGCSQSKNKQWCFAPRVNKYSDQKEQDCYKKRYRPKRPVTFSSLVIDFLVLCHRSTGFALLSKIQWRMSISLQANKPTDYAS